MTDNEYMKLALELAQRGIGAVNPNPLVGAVIVKNDSIIGKGWHQKYGELHAERNALADCTQAPIDATMYVTLEPCCHYGKTPPCTEAILQSGIRRVVIGSKDPNPLVSGRGIEQLRNAGLEVIDGVLEEECDRMNQVFFHYIQKGTPYIVMKYAMTMDGKIATAAGKSKWITGAEARKKVHEDRSRYMGIMAGIGTVLADDPELTCRLAGGRNPIRILCDTHLRTPFKSKIVKTAKEIKTIIATASCDEERKRRYREYGCEIITVSLKEGCLDLNMLVQELGKRKIDSILLEGGSTLNFSALQSGIVNRVQTYLGPQIFGGELAKTAVGGKGIMEVEDSYRLKDCTIQRIGEDFLIESEVVYQCLPES